MFLDGGAQRRARALSCGMSQQETCTRLRIATFFLVAKKTPPIARFFHIETSSCMPDRPGTQKNSRRLNPRVGPLFKTFTAPSLQWRKVYLWLGATSRKKFSQIAFGGVCSDHTSRNNIGLKNAFALHREPRQPPQHGSCQTWLSASATGPGTFLREAMQRLIPFQESSKALQEPKKPFHFLRPGQWL